MIIKVDTVLDCNICDKFLTLLIQDERQYDKSIDENFVVKDYFINMINDNNILLLYKDNNIPLGYIFAKYVDNSYLIDGLYVDINYRNRGIASKLLYEIINYINNYDIYINVIKDNIIAFNLYKSIGFSVISSDGLKYNMKYIK
jgi:ribosomal protein S18 acetylase RimI-like enzyme